VNVNTCVCAAEPGCTSWRDILCFTYFRARAENLFQCQKNFEIILRTNGTRFNLLRPKWQVGEAREAKIFAAAAQERESPRRRGGDRANSEPLLIVSRVLPKV
jgi:hypothetical protein